MLPSVGRCVHYIMPNGAQRAAVVIKVNEDFDVDIRVFTHPDDGLHYSSGLYFVPKVSYGNSVGQWHWPEKT